MYAYFLWNSQDIIVLERYNGNISAERTAEETQTNAVLYHTLEDVGQAILLSSIT